MKENHKSPCREFAQLNSVGPLLSRGGVELFFVSIFPTKKGRDYKCLKMAYQKLRLEKYIQLLTSRNSIRSSVLRTIHSNIEIGCSKELDEINSKY